MPRNEKHVPRKGRPKPRRRSRPGDRKRLSVRLEKRGRALLTIGAALLVAAYAFSRSELLSVASLLIGLPLIALATVRVRRRSMGATRRFSLAFAEVGRPVTVSVEVRNLAPTSTGEARWRDEWPWAPYGTKPVRLPPLAKHRGRLGRGHATVAYELVPPRRGIFDIGPFVVEVNDPFQVARGEMLVDSTQKLVVAPRVVALPVTGLSMEADDGLASARQRLNSASGDDIMTREYRHGDALRRVHWKATARRGELMVRLEEQRSHAQASIVLDTRKSGYHDAVPATQDQPQSDSFEWAVAFTASLALHLQGTGFTVDVIETAHRQLAEPVPQEEFLESFATVDLVDTPVPPRPLPLAPAAGYSRGSLFAVIADAESGTVHSLVTQRPCFDTALAFIVNPRNDRVVAALQDAGWTCITVRSTDDLDAVWRAAAERREANHAGP